MTLNTSPSAPTRNNLSSFALVGGQKSGMRLTGSLEKYVAPAANGPTVFLGNVGDTPVYETNLGPIAGVSHPTSLSSTDTRIGPGRGKFN
jgi:hypothetical protein